MTDPINGLRGFLIARWADETQHAHNALEWLDGEQWTALLPEQEWLARKPEMPLAVRLFVTRQSPQHVINDVAAKARILQAHAPHEEAEDFCLTCGMTKGPCETKRLLALPYRDHPDYRPEWAPTQAS